MGEVSRASNNGSVSFRFDSSRVQIDVANLIKFFKDLVLHEDDVRLAYFWQMGHFFGIENLIDDWVQMLSSEV